MRFVQKMAALFGIGFVVAALLGFMVGGMSMDAHMASSAKLAGLFTEAPIPFRPQNDGDYDDDLRLQPGLDGGATGMAMHRKA